MPPNYGPAVLAAIVAVGLGVLGLIFKVGRWQGSVDTRMAAHDNEDAKQFVAVNTRLDKLEDKVSGIRRAISETREDMITRTPAHGVPVIVNRRKGEP